ncbi:MAG: mauR [Rhodocyclaceae bacterium]|nr:mauR [Rhodocyclaceae bacterium]
MGMDWENLRFFLAVAQDGSLAAAGRRLGVIHTTVMRRIAALEESLGARLFDRHPGGYVLTPAGRELLDTLQPVEDELIAVERRLSGRDQQLTGTVRIASIGAFSPWICDALANLRKANPEVRAEVLISPAAVSIARREADLAVRVTMSPPEYLVGRRVAELAHGIYGAPSFVADGGAPFDPAAHPWLTYNDARSDLPQARWVAEHIPEERVVLRTNHTPTLVSAARAGLGLAILPRYVGDRTPGLRCLETLRGFGQHLWLLTHQDLRRNRRIKVLMDCLAEELAKHRDLIEGTAPLP